jgi:hypothetical protein
MIGFTDVFFYNHPSLRSIITKNCSIPYWTTSVFSSVETDLVLIYESVISSTNDFSFTNESRLSLSLSLSYTTTDGQSASLSWNKAPIWVSDHCGFYI